MAEWKIEFKKKRKTSKGVRVCAWMYASMYVSVFMGGGGAREKITVYTT